MRAAKVVLAIAVAVATTYLLTRATPSPKVTGYKRISDGRGKVFSGIWPYLVTDGPRVYVQEIINERFGVAVVSATGGETVPIQTPFENVSLAKISPDKSELLVGSCVGQDCGDVPLWSLPLVGSSHRRLGELVGHEVAWSPKGELLVARGNELSLARANGISPHKFLTLPGMPYWLRWSPDGNTLRFTVFDRKTDANSLWEASAEGVNPHPLFPPSSNSLDQCCGNWTPDGNYFVFRQRTHDDQIWAIRERARLLASFRRQPVQLTSGPMSFDAPQPSVDGKRIFVIGKQRRVELVRYDAKSAQFLPYLSGMSVTSVTFSRDGRWVAYESYPDGALWRSKVDGTEKLQLTASPPNAELPVWSADGKRIVFQTFDPANSRKLYEVPADGGEMKEIPTGGNGGYASWAPDDNSITSSDDWYDEAGNHSLIKTLHLATKQRSAFARIGGFGRTPKVSRRTLPDGHSVEFTEADAV